VTDEDLKARFEKLETMLAVLIERQQVREYYTSEEFATLVGKAPWTLREYCRLGSDEKALRQGRQGFMGAKP
jgi:hypothetical protein